jgi:hypothetical protein
MIPSLVLLLLLLVALFSGIGWSTAGLPAIAGESALTLHAAFSAALIMLLLPHAIGHWPRFAPVHRSDRRKFLMAPVLLSAGLLVWRGSETLSVLGGLSGAVRRFTGSRAATSFSGNDFPSNSWLLDNPSPIDSDSWRLRVSGQSALRVLQIADLDTADSVTSTIDCTGGWYSTQVWGGVSLTRIIGDAESVRLGSVIVRSATGYWRRLSREQTAAALLATTVGGEPLAHEHGAPARLVVPESRGYDWVKWVTSVEVSRLPWWWRWPLPLS